MSNASVWIIFFVQQDLLPEPFKSNFILLTAVELAGDFFTLFVVAFGVYLFYKVNYFHFNLAVIWVNAYLIGPFFVISRFILIPFQFGYLQDSDIAKSLIENVSTFRFILWISLYHFEILIAVERVFALLFVSTYEKVPRRYISILIIISNYIISAVVGYFVVHVVIHGFYYLAFVCIASNVAYLTFLYLNFAGKRKQSELLAKYRGYSVSYRWQLLQNIEAAKQLSVLMIIINVCICVILPCIFVPALLLEHDESRRDIYEAAKLMLQLLLSLSFGPVYACIALAISKHRQWLWRRNATAPARFQRESQNLSSEAYFARLGEAWNT